MVLFRELSVGAAVFVNNTQPGFVRFLGRVKFAAGEWVGVELIHGDGEHDGSIDGFRYFRCAQNHGVFAAADHVTLRGDHDDGGDAQSPAPNQLDEHERKERDEREEGLIRLSSSSSSPNTARSSAEASESRMNRIRQATSQIASLKVTKPHPSPGGAPASPLLSSSPLLLPAKASSTLPPYSAPRIPLSPPPPMSPPVRRLWVWGENTHGELSSGDELDIRSPMELRAFTSRHDVAQFSLGLQHSVCLTLDNDVYTCGSWISGLLGHEERTNVHRLKRLKQFAELRAINPTNPIISISCGDRHSVALHASGELYTWGGTLYGKLGRTGDSASSSSYYLVSSLQGKRVTHVDNGNWHTAVCTDEGEVYTFGGGGKHFNKGALGTGDMEDSMLPRRIPMFGTAVLVRSLCCGGYHTLALTAERTVYAWGRGEFGQLGLGHDNNEMEPRLIDTLSKEGPVLNLAAGENHSLAVLETGEVWTWGYGQQGQLGHGDGKNEKLPKRVAFFTQRNVAVVQVAAGWRHSLALSVDSHVYAWGHGDKGQLGQGDTKSSLVPKVVESLLGKEVKQVAAGGSHSLAFNAYFKQAQQMYAREQTRQAREKAELPSDADDGRSDKGHAERPSATAATARAPRASNDKNADEKRPSLSSSASSSTKPLTAAYSSSASSLCVELVYSAQVQLTHRFVTFQTHTAPASFTPQLHALIEKAYQEDPATVFDNFIVSPGNVLQRGEVVRRRGEETREDERENHEHVYEYDEGPVRVTLMLVTRTLADDENLWPTWASSMYDVLKSACGDGPENAKVFQPCFREIRPAALRDIIQQRQRRSAR